MYGYQPRSLRLGLLRLKNRERMTLSVFLQVMGYFALRHKVKTRSFAITLEPSAKAR